MIKLYICPIIGDGKTPSTAYRPKIADYINVSCGGMIPSNPDGTPVHSWTLVEVESKDFTEVDADIELIDVFDKFASGITKSELRTFLKSKTVGDIPIVRRNKIQNYLINKGVDLSGINLSTSLWELVVRVHHKILPDITLAEWRAK